MMTTKPRAEFRALTITASPGRADMDQETGRYRYRYTITVQSDGTDAKIRFTFFDSIANYDAGKAGLGPDDLLWAFSCFVSDAMAGAQSFAEFCEEFGYDDDSIRARDTWKACRRSLDKFNRLHYWPTEPADVLEALREMGVE